MLAQEDQEESVSPSQVASSSQPTRSLQYVAGKCKLFWRKAGHKFSHPLGVKPTHQKYVRVVGQIGFAAKGVVYALIGGLACQSAVTGAATTRGADNSPQGAFILLGNNNFGYPLLIVMALSVYMYVCWRFWEGITGQGSDDAFGPFKNFFKYRLSPIVSGCVYTAYGAFCISLIPKIKNKDFATAARSGGFPQSVAGRWWGDTIIAILGIAFLIATITQLQAAFTRNFHYEMKEDLATWFTWLLIVTGHIGFLGRSGVFLFVAILMFRTISSPDINSTDETTIGNALSQLQKTHGGRAGLFILGFFLLVYGTFAVLNSYGKVFPTQPPSGRPLREALPQGPSWEQHVDEHDPENPPDRLERKNNIGSPAWCHSDSRRKLQLDQVQLEALAGASSVGATAQPTTSDYERRKQERLQAIRNLEMMVVKAPGGSMPFTSSSTHEPAHSHGMTPTGSGVIVLTPAAAGTSQQVQVPHSDSELAEIRVSMEDLPNDTQSTLSIQ